MVDMKDTLRGPARKKDPFEDNKPTLEELCKYVLEKLDVKDVSAKDIIKQFELKAKSGIKFYMNEITEVSIEQMIIDIQQYRVRKQAEIDRDKRNKEKAKALKMKRIEEWNAFERVFKEMYSEINIDKIPVRCNYCRYYKKADNRPEIKRELQNPLERRRWLYHIEKNAKGELYDTCRHKHHIILLPRPKHSSCYAFELNEMITRYRNKILEDRTRAEEKRKREEVRIKERETKKQQKLKSIDQLKIEIEELDRNE